MLGRSHRSLAALERIQKTLSQTKQLLQIPDSYHIGIIPGSTTGAMTSALWNFLGNRPVDVFAWDVFGYYWADEIRSCFNLPYANFFSGPIGTLPDLSVADPDHDIVFTWNGTTAGVCVPNADWLAAKRQGLVICDAISAIGAVDLPWDLLDVTAFSWQKAFGGEAGFGMLVLSPRAYEALSTYKPSWPVPRLISLRNQSGPIDGIFRGESINTLSLLAIEDYQYALNWAHDLGGLSALIDRTNQNAHSVYTWLDDHPHLSPLALEVSTRSPTAVCFRLHSRKFLSLSEADQWRVVTRVTDLLAQYEVGYDLKNHARSLPSFRIWTGPTVETQDICALLPWIDHILLHICTDYL
jgi:phosphoserine aminotransferase